MRLKVNFANYILIFYFLNICGILHAIENFETFSSHATARKDSTKPNIRSRANTELNLLIDKNISVTSGNTNNNENVIADFMIQKLLRIGSGVSLSREIRKIPQQSSIFLALKGSFCNGNDIYGSNNCEFQWGDMIAGEIDFQEGITIDETHEIQGVFKLKKIIDWNFSCPACGADCVLHIPILETDITLHLPQCPLVPENGPTANLKKSFTWKLPLNSPLHGMKVSVDGVIYLKNKVNGVTLAEVAVDAFAK